MFRLRDSVWERIRDHFPEENIPDGHPGRSVPFTGHANEFQHREATDPRIRLLTGFRCGVPR